MSVKKQKRHRKIVRFYIACFGFRQPFKVLCDGPFVRHLLVNRITPADTALANTLAAPVKLFTTRCVLAELKREGYSEALEAAHKLAIARCDHEKDKKADACIMEVIGENNHEHLFVATQDTALRKKFQQIPGVPLIFGLRNALLLEPPSSFQREFVITSEEERMHMTDLEYKTLKKRLKKSLVGGGMINFLDEIKDLGDEISDVKEVTKEHAPGNRDDMKDRVRFKRKRAKCPNPLSCKKKKVCENQIQLKENKDSEVAARSRKRKRQRKRQKPAETDS